MTTHGEIPSLFFFQIYSKRSDPAWQIHLIFCSLLLTNFDFNYNFDS